MIIAKFLDRAEKRISYLPVLGWGEANKFSRVALVPGREKTANAGFLEPVTNDTYGEFQKFLLGPDDVLDDIEYENLVSEVEAESEEDERLEVEEFYIYSEQMLGGDDDGVLSE